MESESYESYFETAKQSLITLAEPIVLHSVFFINKKWIHAIRFCEWLYTTHLIHYPFIEFTILNLYILLLFIKGLYTQIYNTFMYVFREPDYPYLGRFYLKSKSQFFSLKYSIEKYETTIIPIKSPETKENDEVADIKMEDNCDITNTFDEVNKEIKEFYYESQSWFNALPREEHIKHELLVIGKDYKDRYYSHVFTGETEEPDYYNWKIPVESKIEFLSISYSHPDMEESISIELSPKYLFCENHILSRTFIAKYLTQLPIYVKYTLDEKYTVDVMDGDLNQIQLGWNDYLIIFSDSYKIQKRKPYIPWPAEPIHSVESEENNYDDMPELEPITPHSETEHTETTPISETDERPMIETCEDDDSVIVSHTPTPNPSDETESF